MDTFTLDLNSLVDVQRSADALVSRLDRIDILINNAGIMACPKSFTKDGIESQFGVNHIGHFHFTNVLLPKLVAAGTATEPARVVNLSSMANYLFPKPAGIEFDNLRAERYYSSFVAYGQSKLANILFTVELNRRLQEEHKPVISVSVHPGVILETDLARNLSIETTSSMIWNALGARNGVGILLFGQQKTIPQGAATSVFTALSKNLVPGEHYTDCAIDPLIHARARDAELAKKLWGVSEQLVAEALQK